MSIRLKWVSIIRIRKHRAKLIVLFLVTQIFCYSSPGLEDIEILSNPFFLLHVFVRSIVSHFLTQFLIVLVTGFALLPESCDGALGNPVVAAGATGA